MNLYDDAVAQSDRHFVANLAEEDTRHIIDTQLGTANYLLPAMSERDLPDRVFYENDGIWNAIILEKIRANMTVTLNSFFLLEWFPRSPGLYFTRDGRQSQEEARNLVESVQDGVVVYNPHGKLAMLKAGVGNIRLRPREIIEEPFWFMSASSDGVSHKGFPVALPQYFYEKYIDEIKNQGDVVCTLVGKLKFIPQPFITLYEDYKEVPQLYLLVDDVRAPQFQKSLAMADLKVSVAVSFFSVYEGFKKVYACYVNFDPSQKESFGRNVEWMEETYVGSKYQGRIITDFDEQMSHFPKAPFSLRKIMDNELDRLEVQNTIGELHIYGDVDKLIAKVENLKVGRLQMIKKKEIIFGDGSTVIGNVVVADIIRDSVNRVNESKLNNEIKTLMAQLTKQVAAASTATEQDLAEGMVRDLKTLSEEITSPRPRRKWYELSLAGIKEAAEKIGEFGIPILETVSRLLPLLASLG